MSSSINDPAAVAALLDKLRASQAWQQAVLESSRQAQSDVPESSSPNDCSDPAAAEIADKGPSVAELLAQLKSSPSVAPPSSSSAPWATHTPPPATHTRPGSTSLAFQSSYPHPHQPQPYPSTSSIESPPAPSLPDLRSCTFQEALPLLSRLADDPAFVTSIREMRHAQDNLERQLLTEREGIQKKYADKVKVAKTKANMVGVGISKHEATMLQDAYQRELQKFDTERVLSAWDGLLAQQQAKLESLRVPSMFVSSDRKDLERQKQVIQVVLGLVQ